VLIIQKGEKVIEEEILEIKEEIDSKKREKERLIGRLESLYNDLETSFSIKTIEEAEETYQDLVNEFETLNKKRELDFNKFKEKYFSNDNN